MAWYNPLTWTDKVIDNVLDKDDGLLKSVGSWVGNMNFTEEEQAEFYGKIRSSVVEYSIQSMSESSERSKARRDIAKVWIKIQLWLVMFCAISIPFDKQIADSYFNLATSTIMIAGTGAIITFFFGSYMLARHNETKKK